MQMKKKAKPRRKPRPEFKEERDAERAFQKHELVKVARDLKYKEADAQARVDRKIREDQEAQAARDKEAKEAGDKQAEENARRPGPHL